MITTLKEWKLFKMKNLQLILKILNTKTAAVNVPTTPPKPIESTSDMLMKKMVDLQNQMLSVMNEIADNTTKSLASDSNMINH
jgi:hypothetical protein